eukprot:CAMPEP_0178534212 /NCGR_PEP_ID=MMETSP0696-20121128/34911_1 /TAXON_ID=265572 /ORGANISM="Extubocellulus spinifer, Strain CCMP396" /LENGTH=68 /DNA_ID=CAMNT_0020166309 /DNA_START=880 /DNA_END=1083 /DNA_ORIENTATION=-
MRVSIIASAFAVPADGIVMRVITFPAYVALFLPHFCAILHPTASSCPVAYKQMWLEFCFAGTNSFCVT